MKKHSIFFMSALLLGIIIIACSPTRDHDLRGIKVTQGFPFIDPTGKLVRYDTFSTRIYKHKDQVLYHGEYKFDSVVSNKSLKSEIRDYFFVYQKGNLFGLFFDKYKNIYGKKLLVDSVVKSEWCNNLNFYLGYVNSMKKPLLNEEKPDPGGVVKTYSFQGIKDTGLTGITSYWLSNKLNHIEYSLSRELDSVYKMKIYRIRIKNNSIYFKDQDFTLDPIEQYFNLEEISADSKSEMMKYFEEEKRQFKKD